MSILIDTGVLYAFLDGDDARHTEAVDVMRRVGAGEWGSPVVSEHVIDELFTLIRHRRLPETIEEAARRILPLEGKSVLRLRIAMLGPAGLLPALEVYRKHRDRRLSFTDATHVALMHRLPIQHLATFDKGLRGIVPVVPE